ncbi:MAG TPA: type II toxin-antitoxin system HigB family toxin [Tepidisphaeraceae bacterium]|jgi:mRNA interferase HigB|nr:type II toxin-antitoxin system HigB family toxin [Tepidisphaeraceae bacterium]
MRVLDERVIARFSHQHADARRWLENWLLAARTTAWANLQDVRRVFPAADGGVTVGSGARVTVFDVCGNRYRMVTNIVYTAQTVAILQIMTHGEYSMERWKRRY